MLPYQLGGGGSRPVLLRELGSALTEVNDRSNRTDNLMPADAFTKNGAAENQTNGSQKRAPPDGRAVSPLKYPRPGAGILTRFPFDSGGTEAASSERTSPIS